MKKIALLALLLLQVMALPAQGPKYDPTGKWLVPDPRDGKPWLIVEVLYDGPQLKAVLRGYPKGSRFEGQKKVRLLPVGRQAQKRTHGRLGGDGKAECVGQ